MLFKSVSDIVKGLGAGYGVAVFYYAVKVFAKSRKEIRVVNNLPCRAGPSRIKVINVGVDLFEPVNGKLERKHRDYDRSVIGNDVLDIAQAGAVDVQILGDETVDDKDRIVGRSFTEKSVDLADNEPLDKFVPALFKQGVPVVQDTK